MACSGEQPAARASGDLGDARQERILFLGKRYYTNKDALRERFGRIFRFPVEWSQSGHEVMLWMIDYHTRELAKEAEGDLQIVSTPPFRPEAVETLWRTYRHFHPTIIVASGDCYVGFLGWLLAQRTGAAFVFDIYDKYDEFKTYVRPLGLDLFGFLRRRSRVRVYSSRALASHYARENAPGASIVAPNGVDPQMFRPLEMLECRRQLGLDRDVRLVGYFGGMEPDRGVADLIDAIALLRTSGQDVRLLICGKLHPSTPLSYDWITYRGAVPHSEMPLYVNASNLVAVPYRLSPFMDMGASCKIAEYLMCERPLVSTRTPNFVANFPLQAVELGAGLCDAEAPADLARAIAFQLGERKVVTVPSDFTWSAIAARTLAAIRAETVGRADV